jgi:carboxyl-terminal processing protease
MNRERIAWTIAVVLVTVFALQVPGTLASRDEDYAFVRKLVDIHRQVTNNYVDEVDESKMRDAAIDGLMGTLDPYSQYIPPAEQEGFDRMLEGSFRGVGIQLNLTDEGKIEVITPIDDSPAYKAGVLAGDQILKVNGESVEGLKVAEVAKKIQGPDDSEVKLTVKHVTGTEETLTMKRQEIVVPTVKGFARKKDNSWDYYISTEPKVAYIRVTQFTPDTFDKLKGALVGADADLDKPETYKGLMGEGMKALILDLRYNPGGRLDQAIKMVDLFVEKGVIVSTKGRSRPEQKVEAQAAGTLPYFPMVVLVNEHSASASEIVAGSLADNKRALVMGERSYGKGSVQELMPLDSKGGELKLTVAYYYLPSGRLVHRKKEAKDWGVEPQVIVPMSEEREIAAQRERINAELMLRPTTGPSSRPAVVMPTTQPTDTQLDAALKTMIGYVVFQGERATANGKMSLTTQPAK